MVHGKHLALREYRIRLDAVLMLLKRGKRVGNARPIDANADAEAAAVTLLTIRPNLVPPPGRHQQRIARLQLHVEAVDL